MNKEAAGWLGLVFLVFIGFALFAILNRSAPYISYEQSAWYGIALTGIAAKRLSWATLTLRDTDGRLVIQI